jgi:hypothetical protein
LEAPLLSRKLKCDCPVIRVSRSRDRPEYGHPRVETERIDEDGGVMAALSGRTTASPGGALAMPGDFILARIAAAGGATRAEVLSDLAPYFTHKLSPSEWRRLAEREIAAHSAAALIQEGRGRLTASERGAEAAARFLGIRSPGSHPWAELRDIALVAKAMGIEREGSARLKALARPEALRALVVQKAFGLPQKRNQPPARLRAQLAVVALERAFGNKIKAGLGKGSALSAKAGRLLAAQLSLNPRDFATDAKLIAELAAEHVGALETDVDGLRRAILRGLASRTLDALESHDPAVPPASRPDFARAMLPAANDRGPPPTPASSSRRPDLKEFARSVKVAAAARAEGWPGGRKAYISHVWQAIRESEPRWGLSEIEFKCMLAEAHRQGAVVLANADLKSKSNLKEIESSAVPYKNSVWHFVRVDE